MNSAMSANDESAALINSTLNSLYEFIISIPGSHLVLNYLKTAYQNDPFRIVLELFLVFFALKYMFSKKYKPHDNAVKLTGKEIDELVEEWQPEPLVPSLTSADLFNLDKTPTIVGPQSVKVKVAGYPKPLMNLATTNFLNLVASDQIQSKAIDTLKNYGVGSCGPPGFYGTIDVHMDLERSIAEFLQTDEAILYSQNFSTVSSVIPAFAKRGDLLVVDSGVNFAIQKGVQISRSNVRWFKHNDMRDLERVLEEIRVDHLVNKKKLTRRFIITEGVFANHGDITPLDQLIKIKYKYKYRLILDESLSIGVLGKRGAGLTDYFGVSASDVDMIVGSLAASFCASGGFCAGSTEVVDHQRLSGLAYCFSASMPAMLAVSASEAISMIQQNPTMLSELISRSTVFRKTLEHKSLESLVAIDSAKDAQVPFFHIRIKSSYFNRSLDRENQERMLQDVVDECANQGVLITRSRYVDDQERELPSPSLKIYVTIGLTEKETTKAAAIVKAAIVKVFTKWKKV